MEQLFYKELCLNCGHLKKYHDGLGCFDMKDGELCTCTIAVDMPSSDPKPLPHVVLCENLSQN